MIKIENITKEFLINNKKKKEIKVALKDISLEIKKGEIVGLIGQNGSGKSTLIKMIVGLYNPTFGNIKIDNEDISSKNSQSRKKIGVLYGGEAGLYNNLTTYENIQYFGMLNGLKEEEIYQNTQKYQELFNMSDYMERRVSNFSRGMKQKVNFLRSIIHNPEIIILDEPSTGLDVKGIMEVSNFIKYNQKLGKTIIISSHNMDEIADLCDKVIILNDGNLVYFGNLNDLLDSKLKYEKLYDLMGVKI